MLTWVQQVTTYVTDVSHVWRSIALALVTFAVFLVFRKVFTRYLFRIVLAWTKRTKTSLDTALWMSFEQPLRFFIVVIGLFLAIGFLPIVNPTALHVIRSSFRSSIVIVVSWGVFNITASSSHWIERGLRKSGLALDRILIPLVSRTLRVLVIIFAFSIVAEDWGYNISSLMAGIGLGGLAFALAAKDVVGNFFGGVVVITEKPFTLDDWIQTPGISGTVEGITLRSTKIRTFDRGLVTIPNGMLVNDLITNWSRMDKRRISFRLGVTYGTPSAKIQACADDIRAMLQAHPGVHKETIFVNFDSFAASSLDLFLYFYTTTTDWGQWLHIKEDCNHKIMEILERHGVSVAFPSTSVYFETDLMHREQTKVKSEVGER